jgi:hypothetical protein
LPVARYAALNREYSRNIRGILALEEYWKNTRIRGIPTLGECWRKSSHWMNI